nr:hypothetical protein [Micromonospora provocatoris]
MTILPLSGIPRSIGGAAHDAIPRDAETWGPRVGQDLAVAILGGDVGVAAVAFAEFTWRHER